ncbi:Putative zinc binding domain-containing protein [Sphingomonas sp. NFR04]|uniref:class I SAM-dependent methyltransferase n=1 Tax=Sphingomonas sp. NFR04 TaxID=1566283 RepID=UPI0008E41011|nr:class I SAM-dependent methyltransferase [Sphingomonas sp. NFR04]SFJ04236.1 Putative zinc binding domain-containing protein [Sphingomonas sp. NFR04]
MEQLDHCRACLAPKPYLFLPLGAHPPANMFVRPSELEEAQPSFALNTQACLHCGLIQVADQIPADFFRQYLYVPSGATTMHHHFDELAATLSRVAEGGLIVDIGCNDGLLLRACNALGCRTLGIDPAANLAEIANGRGVEVHVAYFDPAVAKALRTERGPAKVIVTTNTFNHIGDLHLFMEGIERLLADDGVFVIEVPWAKDLLEKNEFDTVYHEHVSEFSLLSIAELGRYFGLDVVDVTRLPIHGGSMRVFLRPAGIAEPTPEVGQMLAEERDGGMLVAATYDAFADRIGRVRTDLTMMLEDLKRQGLKVAGYGAPAKGNTLLNYFGIGTDALNFLVDRNPLKQGLYSPGMKIPVLSPDAIAREQPDVLLVLAWNFFDEIREQQSEFTSRGGRFLVPLPEPVLVG